MKFDFGWDSIIHNRIFKLKILFSNQRNRYEMLYISDDISNRDDWLKFTENKTYFHRSFCYDVIQSKNFGVNFINLHEEKFIRTWNRLNEYTE